jgi:hypothetical protein
MEGFIMKAKNKKSCISFKRKKSQIVEIIIIHVVVSFISILFDGIATDKTIERLIALASSEICKLGIISIILFLKSLINRNYNK